jgi:hypothetical protein
MVLQETWTDPCRKLARIPDSPKTTLSTAGSSASMVNKDVGTARLRWNGGSAGPALQKRLVSIGGAVIYREVVAALSRFIAIGEPMFPRPMNPTFINLSPHCLAFE